ncbi:TPA: type II toxin-antitoxin system YafO family toxin [Enterobacter bugandensis]|nr:type II toxin-antitoxin system YafO family toxin [Enterobacter bugandensis]
MQNEYQGKVYTGKFGKVPELVPFKDAFIQHWRYAHHHQFGKDTAFARPPEILAYHLRKVHVDVGLYSDNHGYSGTEQCWNDWKTGKKDPKTGKRKITPTSDAYLIYLVTSERNAVLLDFWYPPAHKTADLDAQMDKLIVECGRIHEIQSSQPMPRDAELWGPEFCVDDDW